MPLEYALQPRGEKLTAWDEPAYPSKAISGTLGFVDIPAKSVVHATRKGYRLNLLLVGDAGLGKSTLLNTLFRSHLIENGSMSASERRAAGLRESSFDVVEDDIKLHLNVVDTPGLGLTDKREEHIKDLVAYLDAQHTRMVQEEEKVHRDLTIPDGRVHALLYFIPPRGHALRDTDIELLKAVHEKTNVILIIAKADTLTQEEITGYKQRVMANIREHNISIFSFEDDDGKELFSGPFAVIGSETTHLVDGKQVLGRKYRWGVAEVENEEHCDFVRLRELLLQSHCLALKLKTDLVHYEHFRSQYLESQGRQETILPADKDFEERLASERSKLKKQFEKESEKMRQALEKMVKEKEEELAKQDELRLKEREAMLKEIDEGNRALAAEKAELDKLEAELASAADEDKKRRKGLMATASLLGRSKKS